MIKEEVDDDQFSVPNNDATAPVIYTCNACGQCCQYSNQMINHLVMHDIELRSKNWPQNDVDAVYTTTDSAVDVVYTCVQCNTTYPKRNAFYEHIHIHTGKSHHICEVCGKFFLNASSLYRHMPTHTGEKRHMCDYCGSVFLYMKTLRYHQRIHTAAQSTYVCAICDCQYHSRTNLVEHFHRDHGAECPFSCSLCGQQFGRLLEYREHMGVHRGSLKRHLCLDCGLTFSQKLKLMEHDCQSLNVVGMNEYHSNQYVRQKKSGDRQKTSRLQQERHENREEHMEEGSNIASCVQYSIVHGKMNILIFITVTCASCALAKCIQLSDVTSQIILRLQVQTSPIPCQ